MSLIQKYTSKNRTFKFAPDGRFICVYYNGKLNGFIWNTDKVIVIDGDHVVSSAFFH